jgi:hypothetical protein
MDESFLRVVTDDDDTPKKKTIDPFLKVKFDVDPFCSYCPSSGRWRWNELLGVNRCNQIYLRRDKDTVRSLKIFISACFTVDIAVDNLKLRIVEETPAGSGKYVPHELNDDNTILGLHSAVKQNEVWIWVSKKIDMRMWHVLEYKIDHSETTEELKNNNIIMEKTMLLVEDKWLIFVKDHLDIINDIFEFDLLVWLEGGGKEKYMNEERTYINKTIVEQLEQRQDRFERLRINIIRRRVCDETPAIRSEREELLNELYFNGNDPRSV